MNDEQIGAFLDNELSEPEKKAFEQTLAADPGGAMRLSVFGRIDDVLRQAFGARFSIADYALAQRLLDSERPMARPPPAWTVRVAVLAAACLAGAVLGLSLGQRPAILHGAHWISPALVAAIENTPSGRRLDVNGASIVLAQTIRTDAGYCREFQIADQWGATDALACRSANVWRIAVATPITNDDGRRFHAAGAARSAIDAVLEARGNADLVDETDEKALMDSGWRTEPHSQR